MNVRKAITFRASSIGDCLMAKYLMENIHTEFPQARCAIIVSSRATMIRDLFEAYPWLDIIEASRRNPRTIVRLWRKYRRSDLAVIQYAGKPGGKFSFASKLMARLLTRRGGCIGFGDSFRLNHLLFDSTIPIHPDRAVAWHDREVLRVAGVSLHVPFPVMSFKTNPDILQKYRLRAGKFILVHLFAGGAGRGMNPDRKKELVALLVHKYPGTQIVLSGGASDRMEAIQVAKSTSAMVIAGETTLQELMNLISESSGVVSVDTGVAHIAAHIGKPLVVLRTCVAPNWWFADQYGHDAPITVLSHDTVCAAGHIYKDYPDCINSIPIDTIGTAVEERIYRSAAIPSHENRI